MKLKHEKNKGARAVKAALSLALGAALLFGLPSAGLAQKGGNDRRPPNAPHEVNKKEPHKPPMEHKDNKGRGGKGGDFNKWDKGWQGPDAKHKPGAKQQPRRGGNDFKRFDPGIDRSRARDMARSHKMTGYKPLPDSARKSMHIGRPLPPRIDHRPVPEYMRKRLPPHPGYEWRITGRDLVLVAVGSLVVYEIFDNVFD